MKCENIDPMFEQMDEPKKKPEVSIGMALGVYAAYLVGAFGGIGLFVVLGHRPFGIQLTTVIVYTYFAFWYVFFPTRGLLEKYSLRNKVVQRQIPRLLAIHCAFLALILIGQTAVFAMKPHLPGYWLTERGKNHDTLYDLVPMVSYVIIFFTQVLISRRILSRRLKENPNEMDSEGSARAGIKYNDRG